MDVLYPRCAGLHVHADAVVACVRTAGRSIQHTHRTVATTTRGLLELAQWLRDQEVTHVAIEATGVFWKPVWHVLEDSFTLVQDDDSRDRRILVGDWRREVPTLAVTGHEDPARIDPRS